MNEREALKLALEALEYEAEKGNDDAYRVEREAIKEALTQPEPVIDKSAAIRIATSLGWEPKRKPMTDEELFVLLSKMDEHAARLPRGLRQFARAIEAAHGIKE